jgi:hypothetical protein
MALSSWLIIDVASAPLPNAEKYLEGTVKPRKGTKDEDKIAAQIAAKTDERLAMAALDFDLARVTGFDLRISHPKSEGFPRGNVLKGSSMESSEIQWIGEQIAGYSVVTFGGFNFDLPLLMRRARYLKVPFPTLNLDRYRSQHVDLCELLSDRNPQRRRSLDFYVKRMGWDDLMPKPLSGAEEAQVPISQRWDELAASLKRDVEAIYRLAVWCQVIEPVKVMDAVQAETGF